MLKSENPVKNIRSLMRTNQHKGFDCPGCAWGDQKSGHKVSFCENGAKAVNWEATAKKVGADFLPKIPSAIWIPRAITFWSIRAV
ncbi:hypothetical protein [Aliamphritea spongicola]|nr:hypothetical protein [Aliamphritea spongicola]